MKISTRKRLLSWVIAFLMVFAYAPAATYATDSSAVTASTEITVLDGQISVTDTAGTAKISNGVITATAAGLAKPTDKLVPNTVTIKNTTAKYVEVSFDYEAENYYEFSEEQPAGNYTVVLGAGESAELTISGKKTLSNNTAVLTLENFSLIQVSDVSQITFEYDDKLGSVTSGDVAVAAGETVNAAYETGIEMKASPASGAKFLGWINAKTGKIVSRELSTTYKPVENITIEAVFINDNSGSYYLVGNRFIMTDFDAAMKKAQDQVNPVVAMMNDITLTAGKYTVPAGVTLLVPYDDKNTVYRELPLAEHSTYTTPKPYRTLTMKDGAELIVNGEMSLSAKHYAGASSEGKAGAPFGDVPFVKMEKGSAITVNDDAFLYAYGYITGEGTVTAKSGATVYEYFQVEDFRGGSCTTNMAAKEEGEEQQGVLPISQYYVQNIEVPLTIEYGATEFCYTSLFMLNTPMGSAIKFIGDDTAMFCLKDGFVTKSYDGSVDRLNVEGNGNMGVNPITVDLLGEPVNASMFDLPIGMNITITVKTGNVDMNQDVALLPGSKIVIDEGAACTLGEGVSVYVYDLDQWDGYVGTQNIKMIPINYAPGKKYNRTVADLVDAAIEVNGELDASKGYLYTTRSDADTLEGGGNIYSSENGVVKIFSGGQEYTYQFIQNGITGTYVPIYLLPANLVNDDGNYVQTYDTSKAGTYTYVNGKWQCSHEVDETQTVVVSKATCETAGITTQTCKGDIPHTYDVVTPATGHDWDTDVTVDKAATCKEAGTESIHCSKCDATKDVTEVEALGHDFAEYKVTKAATCTADGSEESKCTRCDEVDVRVIKATGHDYKYEGETPATCTEPGTMSSGKCAACGNEIPAGVIPALGHSFTKYEQTTAPTCNGAGVETAKCDRCDATDSNDIAALGHKFGRYVDQNDATCTTGGHKVAQCTRCDAKDEKDTPALGHNWEKNYTVDKAADCDDRGSKSKHCSVCDVIDEDSVKVIYALGHDWGAWKMQKASTCVEHGVDKRVCEVCDVTAERERALADHTWNSDFTVDFEPTCGEEGQKSIHCAECNETKDVTPIAAIGHEYEYKNNTATCTASGTETGECKFGCGSTNTRNTAALGHKWAADYTVDKEATCSAAGSKSIHCERCDAKDKVTEIAKKAHTYGEWKETKAPTCTATGIKEKACTVCGDKQQDTVAAKGHSYGEWKETKAATCTAAGSKEKVCATCGSKETADVPALGHNWNKSYTVDKAPTCTAEGSESIHCAVCDQTKAPRSIDKLGHKWAKDYTVDKAATCTTAGSKSIHCTVCDAKDKVTEIAVTAHTYGDWTVISDSTCTAEGSKERACTACGNKETEAIAMKAHTEVTDAAVAAGCKKTGLTEGTHCSVCDTVLIPQKVVAAKGHKWKKTYTIDKTATTARAGSKSRHCSVCNAKGYVTSIARISKIVKASNLVYNGKKRAAVLTVVNLKGKKLKSGTDYTVTYKNAKGTKAATPKLVGKYTAVIKFKGSYSGTVKKTFNINPKATTVSKLTKPAKKQIKVTWKRQSVQTTGYQIQYSTSKSFTKKTTKSVYVSGAKSTSKVIKKLKSKKTYWVKVRTYKTVSGVKYYSSWSKAKSTKTK